MEANSKWVIKMVQGGFCVENVFDHIRQMFDTADEEDFLRMRFAFVHFNHYGTAPWWTMTPAEFCCVDWTLATGLDWFGGSPIDPGDVMTNKFEMFEQSRKLILPTPPYTYNKGVEYSVGDDRFGVIVTTVYNHAVRFPVPEDIQETIEWKYVFARDDNVKSTVGCLAWLIEKSGDPATDLPIRVLPLERFVSELFRTCQIRRFTIDLKAQVVLEMEEMRKGDNAVPRKKVKVEFESGAPVQVKSESKFDSFEFLRSVNLPSISDGQNSVVKKVSSIPSVNSVLDEPTLNNRLRLGCLWHQMEQNCDGINLCSIKLCKKWAYLTIQKALDILDKPELFEPHAKFVFEKADMNPQKWTIQDAMGIEARQRFGFFGGISEKRVAVLEDHFIFPALLNELKRRMPDGLTTKPVHLIWPVDRDIEKDLNWSEKGAFFVHDPEPGTRAKKKEEKVKRDKEMEEERKRMDDW